MTELIKMEIVDAAIGMAAIGASFYGLRVRPFTLRALLAIGCYGLVMAVLGHRDLWQHELVVAVAFGLAGIVWALNSKALALCAGDSSSQIGSIAMKTCGLMLWAILCASCATEFKTRPPKDFVWHTVTEQEDLGMIALRHYDNPKAGFIYLQQVNFKRLLDQSESFHAAPGTRLMVPSKAEFEQWLRDNEGSGVFDKYASIGPGTNFIDLSSGKHWGGAYQSGMEHGPASKEHAIAAKKAEAFLAKQSFADQFAKRAYAFNGFDPIEVSFITVSIPGGETRGVVRVNPKTGECSWLGVKDAAPRTLLVVALPANGVVAATRQQQQFLERLESLSKRRGASQEEVQIWLGNATQATATNLLYRLSEDRTTGGYYVGATLTFTPQGLDQIQVHGGHETRSEPQHR